MKIRWLNSATRSMRAAHQYIAAFDPTAARRTVNRIESLVGRLAEFPQSGRLGTVAGTRELVIAGLPYIVVYMIADSEVVILRVFHAKQGGN
jgi:addiction module RelE/StbE family toxin